MTEPTPPLVPADFAVPTGFSTDLFVLEPLGVGHNESDYSWVRADRAALDKPLYDAVRRWLAEAWPFRAPDYAER